MAATLPPTPSTDPPPGRSFLELAAALRDVDRDQPGRTFDLLARMLYRTDAELQHRTGISRQTINAKRTGASRVSARDLWPLAEAVEVVADVLLLPPAEAAAWLAEHRAEVLNGATERNRGDSAEQRIHGAITHRRRDIPCKRPLAVPYIGQYRSPRTHPHRQMIRCIRRD